MILGFKGLTVAVADPDLQIREGPVIQTLRYGVGGGGGCWSPKKNFSAVPHLKVLSGADLAPGFIQIKWELGTLKSLSKAASSTDFPKAKWVLRNTRARQAERDKREARERDDGDDWGRGSVQGI